MKKTPEKEIYTIGHSTHSAEEFIAFLKAHRIECLIDVRTIPRSLYCPQFDQEALKRLLKSEKIGYRHRKELGGFRHAKKDSINRGWKNKSFRGFADYMLTPAFQKGLEKLEKIAETKRCALMCAEALPWRCHRNLISDALSARKWKVYHIQNSNTAKRHKRTSFAKIKKRLIFYPASDDLRFRKD